MKLHLHEWGTGDRLALLVHGIMADHRTFARTGPALAARGYRVLAVDLRGHGATGPAAPYTLDAFADDLLDTLPVGAELALGHSLGGLALARAAERLAPARAVYEDPAWFVPGPSVFEGLDLDRLKRAGREEIAAASPRWSAEDVDTEVDTLRLWDPATTGFLDPLQETDLLPARPIVPSLVVLADGSHVVSPDRAALLAERGFEVRTVPGAGHVIHRDDFDGFLKALGGWI